MLKNIFKTLMIGIALCATCSIVAVNAGEPVKWKNGKKYIVHSVKAKETLFGVCKTYHLTQAELVAANPQAKGGLQKGMNLLIPAKGSKTETAKSTATKPAAKTTAAKQAKMMYHLPGISTAAATLTTTATPQTTRLVRSTSRGTSSAKKVAGIAKSSPQARGLLMWLPSITPRTVETAHVI